MNAHDDDTAAPEGYSRPVTRRMTKAPPPDNDVAGAVDDGLEPATAKTTTVAPPAPAHGRPKGAGNAVAFHEWKKPPKPDAES